MNLSSPGNRDAGVVFEVFLHCSLYEIVFQTRLSKGASCPYTPPGTRRGIGTTRLCLRNPVRAVVPMTFQLPLSPIASLRSMAHLRFSYNLAARVQDSADLHIPAQDGPFNEEDVDPNDYFDWILSCRRERERPRSTSPHGADHTVPSLTRSGTTLSVDSVHTEPCGSHPLLIYTYARISPYVLADRARLCSPIPARDLHHFLRISRDSLILNVSTLNNASDGAQTDIASADSVSSGPVCAPGLCRRMGDHFGVSP